MIFGHFVRELFGPAERRALGPRLIRGFAS